MIVVREPWCEFPHAEPRRATVLFDGAFHCSLCAEVLLGDAPARALVRIECTYFADRLLEALAEEEARWA